MADPPSVRVGVVAPRLEFKSVHQTRTVETAFKACCFVSRTNYLARREPWAFAVPKRKFLRPGNLLTIFSTGVPEAEHAGEIAEIGVALRRSISVAIGGGV